MPFVPAIASLIVLLVSACASAPPAARVHGNADLSDKAASVALKMVGKPYRFGGDTPSRGFDCSGLVQFTYRQAGLSVPRSTERQLQASRAVSHASMRRGDLLFFDQEGKKKSHVGIYLGDGRFVHAPSSGKQVRVDRLESRYWRAHLSEVRRF